MALHVWLTVFLRQEGPAESKDLDKAEASDAEPRAHPGAPYSETGK